MRNPAPARRPLSVTVVLLTALVLALAGSLARQGRAPATAGTLPTHSNLFVGLVVFTAVLVTALVFFPVLSLGPLAEGLL